MTDANEDFVARHVLSQLIEPGDLAVGRAVQEFGAPEVLNHLQALECARPSHPGMSKLKLPSRWSTGRARELAERETEQSAKLGVDFLIPGRPDWPTQLSDLGARVPLMLRSRGELPLRSIAVRGVGIVGARACTRYGRDVTEDLASRLASNDWTVISGGAYGIDAAAHRGALAIGGATIAVSAAGVDRAVPASNASLFEAISRAGAIVSETPLGSHPTRSRFLVRNRLIAALARGVVVTEAALRSGSLSTAREASRLGRVLMSVPGPITSLSSAGGHELVKEGISSLVTGHSDVIELLRIINSDPDAMCSTRYDQVLLAALRGDLANEPVAPVGIDGLSNKVQLPVDEVLVGLSSLEARQLVDRSLEGWQLVKKRSLKQKHPPS